MKFLPLLLIPLLSVSCVSATADRVISFGGKGAYKGRDFALVFDTEKSFRDGALAVAAVAAASFSASTQKAAEVTAQAANAAAAQTTQKQAAEAAAVEITKSNNAVKMAELGLTQ
jgi:hypothetical protein